MTRLLPILAFLSVLAASPVEAGQGQPGRPERYLEEGFAYPDGDLRDRSSKAWSRQQGDAAIRVEGKQAILGPMAGDAEGGYVTRRFARPATGPVVEAIVAVRVDPATLGEALGARGETFLQFAGNDGKARRGRLALKSTLGGDAFRIGVASVSSSRVRWSRGELSLGEVHLVRLVYDTRSGETWAWANPTTPDQSPDVASGPAEEGGIAVDRIALQSGKGLGNARVRVARIVVQRGEVPPAGSGAGAEAAAAPRAPTAVPSARADAVEPPPRDRFWVFVLAGQSNMAGRGEVADSDRVADPRILAWRPGGGWVPATEPLHDDKPLAAGVGPGLAFARALLPRVPADVSIGLVPVAFGGTRIAWWRRDYAGPQRWADGSTYHARLLEGARDGATRGRLMGVLWSQGESDSGAAERDAGVSYREELGGLIGELRDGLGMPALPFVASTLGPWKAQSGAAINAVYLALPGEVPGTAVVDTLLHADELRAKEGDPIHYDAPSARRLGALFADAMVPFLPGPAVPATPARVQVTAEVVGRTPDLIGYNMGDNLPGSGVSHWLDYSGLKAARFWWPREAWPEPPAPRGLPGDLPGMTALQAALRADPAPASAAHARVVAALLGPVPEGTLGEVFSLSELRRRGVVVLAPMTFRWRDLPFDAEDGSPHWGNRWTYWRGVYLNAYYLATRYGVESFQLFNEPDHALSLPLTQDEFLRRLQLGSDAVRAAVADAGRDLGKHLVARVSAPVSAGIEVYLPRSGRPDTRDLERGWGQMITRALRDPVPGAAMPGSPLYDDYAIQFYTREDGYVTGGVGRLREAMRGDLGDALPRIIASELNVSTAANFARTEETLDSPSYFGAWGRLAIEAIESDLRELYVFRLTQTANLGGGQIKKNGTHVIALDDPLLPITRITRGGEVVRLVIEGFSGARDRLRAPEGLPAPVEALVARDRASGTVTALVTNPGENQVDLDLAFGAFPELAGARAEVAEVSLAAHGALVGLGRLGENLSLPVSLAPAATLLVTLTPRATAASEGVALASPAADRWTLAGPRTSLLRVETTATVPATIVRLWLDDASGSPVRLLGHVVANARPQWLRLGETPAGATVRAEREEGSPAGGLVTALIPVAEE